MQLFEHALAARGKRVARGAVVWCLYSRVMTIQTNEAQSHRVWLHQQRHQSITTHNAYRAQWRRLWRWLWRGQRLHTYTSVITQHTYALTVGRGVGIGVAKHTRTEVSHHLCTHIHNRSRIGVGSGVGAGVGAGDGAYDTRDGTIVAQTDVLPASAYHKHTGIRSQSLHNTLRTVVTALETAPALVAASGLALSLQTRKMRFHITPSRAPSAAASVQAMLFTITSHKHTQTCTIVRTSRCRQRCWQRRRQLRAITTSHVHALKTQHTGVGIGVGAPVAGVGCGVGAGVGHTPP
jgi:hypothetical protein